METLYAFTQSQQEVYKKLIILLTIFIIAAFGLYVSYVLNDRKNYPMYLSEQTFDMWLNHSDLNQPKESTVINGLTVNQVDSLNSFSDVQFCPKGQCSVNLSTGVKICPSTVNKNSSSNANSSGITYTPGIEVCVDPGECPGQLPYAVRNNGEAFNKYCDDGAPCYCTSNPQCATRALKYFFNQGTGTPGGIFQDQLNFSFATIGDKEDDNLYNNIFLDVDLLSDQYCKLNPAFTDKIVNGCNFANTWNDPTGCEFTNIYTENTVNYDFITIDPMETAANFRDVLQTAPSLNFTQYQTGMNFLGISPVSPELFNPTTLADAFSKEGIIQIGDSRYYFTEAQIRGHNVLLKNIYDNNSKGLTGNVAIGATVGLSVGKIVGCQDPSNSDVNFKNMLTCVQPYNQPCNDGVLAYNVDQGNPRGFCQGTGLSLVLGQGVPINDFFLVNPAYFTMSCVIGSGCDDSIDTAYCAEADDCTNAFIEKKNKLFPLQDLSALTNQFSVPPSNYGLSYTPIITVDQSSYDIKNNLINLDNGDYWIIRNSTNNIYLTNNGISGTSIVNVNNVSGLTTGMNVNFSQNFTIQKIDGTSLFLSPDLDFFDQSIARAGYELVVYGGNSFYGYVYNVQNFVGHQTFNLYDSTNNRIINDSVIGIADNTITFYKQFGFNGLNYNSNYSLKDKSRTISNFYYYKTDDFPGGNNITLPFSEYEFITQNKNTAILNSNSSFAQKYSMYYPVFNESNFKQECVYCSPSLHVFPYVEDSTGGVCRLNIQFSGQEYYHYGYGNLIGDFRYHHISFGLTALSKNRVSNQSNCSCIVLNKGIEGLAVGDYVIDEEGLLGKLMVDSNNNVYNTTNGFIMATDFGTSNIPDDKYLPYKLSGNKFIPNNGNSFTLDATEANLASNVFYGKAYLEVGDANFNEYYIRPLVKILKISDDLRTIITDSPSLMPIAEKKIIQFISPREDLEIIVQQDPQSVGNAPGSGALLSIGSIANGRIVSLNVDQTGQGYSNVNRPVIFVGKYSPNTSPFNISN